MTDETIQNAELRAIVERIEAQNERIKDEQDARKAIYDEAKGRGYDVKAIRAIIALRRLTPDDRAQQEATLDLYASALGMA